MVSINVIPGYSTHTGHNLEYGNILSVKECRRYNQ